MRNTHKIWLAAVALGFGALAVSRASSAADAKKSAAEVEKEKALANPYANDLGPDTLDAAVLKGYPAEVKKGYDLMVVKCARCHTAARPLNSRFVEPDAPKDKRGAVIAGWRKTTPELFKEPAVWQVEENIWQRYVKRMQSKPGCALSNDEAKAIWKFLVYDSNERKVKKAAEWKAHRKKLLDELKAKHPKRYKELEEQKDL